MKRRVITFGALALLALAPLVTAAEGITIQRKATVGEKQHLKLQIEGEVSGTAFVMNGRFSSEVKEVTPGGEISTEEQSQEQILTVGGMQIPLPGGQPIRQKRDRLGRLLSLEDPNPASLFGPAVGKALAMVSSPLLPEKPVAPGESWSGEYDNPVKEGSKLTLKTTYAGPEKVGEQELHKLTQVATVPTPMGDAVLNFTFWIEPARGISVRQESQGKDIPTQFGPMSWKQSMELVPAPA